MKEKEVNNEQKIIATNKTNPVLMKIARREKWIKPFAKKLTAEDASRVTELRFQKLFVAFVPAKGDEEMLVTAIIQHSSPLNMMISTCSMQKKL